MRGESCSKKWKNFTEHFLGPRPNGLWPLVSIKTLSGQKMPRIPWARGVRIFHFQARQDRRQRMAAGPEAESERRAAAPAAEERQPQEAAVQRRVQAVVH